MPRPSSKWPVPAVLPGDSLRGEVLSADSNHPEPPDPFASLTRREREFVSYYCDGARGRPSHALWMARNPGKPLPPTIPHSVCQDASMLLKKPHVREAISALLDIGSMSKWELLSRVSDYARGVPPECWEADSEGGAVLQVDRLIDRGLSHLIVGFDREGRAVLANPLKALELLAKLRGMLAPDTVTNVQVNVATLSDEELRRIRDTGRTLD